MQYIMIVHHYFYKNSYAPLQNKSIMQDLCAEGLSFQQRGLYCIIIRPTLQESNSASNKGTTFRKTNRIAKKFFCIYLHKLFIVKKM